MSHDSFASPPNAASGSGIQHLELRDRFVGRDEAGVRWMGLRRKERPIAPGRLPVRQNRFPFRSGARPVRCQGQESGNRPSAEG